MKSTAPKAAGVILEATHKLKGAQVPGYMKANFEKILLLPRLVFWSCLYYQIISH